jgi:hypothetical protein
MAEPMKTIPIIDEDEACAKAIGSWCGRGLETSRAMSAVA